MKQIKLSAGWCETVAIATERAVRPFLEKREAARALWPDLGDIAAQRRLDRALAAGAVPGVMRMNRRRTVISRAVFEAWLRGERRMTPADNREQGRR